MVLGGSSSSWWGSRRVARRVIAFAFQFVRGLVSDFGKMAGITAASFPKDKNWSQNEKIT